MDSIIEYYLRGFGGDDALRATISLPDRVVSLARHLVDCDWGDGIGEMPISRSKAAFLAECCGHIIPDALDWFVSPSRRE